MHPNLYMYFWTLSDQTLSLFSLVISKLQTRIVFIKFYDYFIFCAIFIPFLNPPSCNHFRCHGNGKFWYWQLDSENSCQVGDHRKLILEEMQMIMNCLNCTEMIKTSLPKSQREKMMLMFIQTNTYFSGISAKKLSCFTENKSLPGA